MGGGGGEAEASEDRRKRGGEINRRAAVAGEKTVRSGLRCEWRTEVKARIRPPAAEEIRGRWWQGRSS